MPSDGRIPEPAGYHQIPHITADDINEGTGIFKLYGHADLSSVKQRHALHFAHYAGFRERNGLGRTYRKKHGFHIRPFDEKMAAVPQDGPLRPLNGKPLKEQDARLQTYGAFLKEGTEKQGGWIKMIKMLPNCFRKQ